MKEVHSAYNFLVLSLIALVLLLCSIFIILVNPLDIFHHWSVPGFNESKPQASKYIRLVKPWRFKEIDPDLAIFGASYVSMGFDPEGFFGNPNAYNFGIEGAAWEEIYCAVEYALESGNIQHIILGMLAKDMPEINCHLIFDETNAATGAGFSNHLSFDMFKISLKTIINQAEENAEHTYHGVYAPKLTKKKIKGRFEKILKRHYKSKKNNSIRNTEIVYSLKGLNRLWKKANEKGIKMDFVFIPRHAALEYMDYCFDLKVLQLGLMQQYFQHYKDEGPTFWSLRAFTREYRLTPNNQKDVFWYDLRHFSPLLGNKMIEDVLKNNDAGYALSKVTKGNLAEYEQQIKGHYDNLLRNKWITDYVAKVSPDLVQDTCKEKL